MANLIALFFFLIVLISGFFLLINFNKFSNEIEDHFEIKDNETCFEHRCVQTTLTDCNYTKDLGVEKIGFLSSEHYYICDNIKLVKDCLEWDWVETNKSSWDFLMKCEASNS